MITPSPGGRVWLLAGTLALLTACATPRGPYVIALPSPGARPVAHIDAIRDDAQALASLGMILEREFGLPPAPVRLEFYPGTDAFETALLAFGYDAAMARDSALNLKAIAASRRVLLNERALGPEGSLSRLATFAHELVHCAQYELGGGRRGTSDQWLREGFAEWVAMAALDRLGALSFATVRRFMREAFEASDRSQAPALDEMVTFRQMVALAGRTELALPAQSFLAVDRLVATHGVSAVIDYFRRFSMRENRDANFQGVFGESRAAFGRRIDTALGIERPHQKELAR